MHTLKKPFYLLTLIAVSINTFSCTHWSSGPASKSPIVNTKQFIFEGKRSGEGYFSSNGQQMIYQSERGKSNPFFQIYLRNMQTGTSKRLSPGYGKTTCAWIHPTKNLALFSSTHLDPTAKVKQKSEYQRRKSPHRKHYSWSYDKYYDIFSVNKTTKKLKRLTFSKGYDAEASYSPKGKYIAFASNRLGYTQKLSPLDKKLFAKNSSYMMDIYIMDSNGNNVKQLTTTKGYDGGPFFSPKGKKIVWRKFSASGETAEIYTMNIDGSEKKQLTHLNAMSWAPFYHPSGDYIIFTTNLHGHSNFELYIVDSKGTQKPKRVSFHPGFDGLPVFHPNGKEIYWTTQKSRTTGSQLYKAKWDDKKARQLLNLPPEELNPTSLSPSISTKDLKKEISYLSSKNLKGRLSGSPEENIYTQKIASLLQSFNLKPAGDKGTYFQKFPFISSVKVNKKKNNLYLYTKGIKNKLTLNQDWVPLGFSGEGFTKKHELVFVGYGIKKHKTPNHRAYNSYRNLNVKNKWVISFRFSPENLTTKQKQEIKSFSQLSYKVSIAKQLGAKGVIFVSGPTSQVKKELININYKSGSTSQNFPVISITDKIAADLLGKTKKEFTNIQKNLDTGKLISGFNISHKKIQSKIHLTKTLSYGINVLAKLTFPRAQKSIIVGAHADHLGSKETKYSLASVKNNIHFGADDNASGVASVIEVAHFLSQNKDFLNQGKKNIIFAFWSGEELGLLGSQYYVDKLKSSKNKITSYINLDMIGRLKKNLILQGLGSSSQWQNLIEKVNAVNSLSIKTQSSPYLPTDAMSFYLEGIPILSFFTGVHEDYHTPTDTAEKINYSGLKKISLWLVNLIKTLSKENINISYNKVKHSPRKTRGGFRVSLGTIPNYSQKDSVIGVQLHGVKSKSPAERSGLKKADIIISLSGINIENIYDFVYALQTLKANQSVNMLVLRNKRKIKLNITPESRI